MKNTGGLPYGWGSQPQRVQPAIQKTKKETEVSLRLINFVLMYKQLTSEQRSQIFALLQRKSPRKEIARIVGISESTLSRELKRNSTDSGKYLWLKAHRKAMARRERTKRNGRLAPELVWRIKELIIQEQWSPKQIAGALRREGVKVSHQTIYNMIHQDTTGLLAANTRHKMKYRKRPKTKHMPIADRTSIHERPKEADGKRFGDFEMDLIVDPYNHAILTITERSTNMIFMTKLQQGKKSKPIAEQVYRILMPYREYLKSMTTDNGPEFAAHKEITRRLGVKVYFADPYASWQKGAIENANKLIRQYIEKNANFNDFTDKKIMTIQKKLNSRPRQKLNFRTPKEVFYQNFQ